MNAKNIQNTISTVEDIAEMNCFINQIIETLNTSMNKTVQIRYGNPQDNATTTAYDFVQKEVKYHRIKTISLTYTSCTSTHSHRKIGLGKTDLCTSYTYGCVRLCVCACVCMCRPILLNCRSQGHSYS